MAKPMPVATTTTDATLAEWVLPLTVARETKNFRVLAATIPADTLIIGRDGSVYLPRSADLTGFTRLIITLDLD